MKTNLDKQAIYEDEKINTKTHYESNFYFEEDDEELIWIYCENDCIAEVFISIEVDNTIYCSVNLNPNFEVDFDNLQSKLEDFLACERDYNLLDIHVKMSPFSGDIWT